MTLESTAFLVLQGIYRNPSITRRMLSELVGRSVSHTSSLVSRLLELKLIREESEQDGLPGRPPGALRINPEAGRVVGLDIGSTHSRAVLCDLAGNVRASHVRPNLVVPEREAVLESVAELVSQACASEGLEPSQVTALGVGVLCILDSRTGTVLDWPNQPGWVDAWRGVSVPEELHRRLGIPLVVADDAVRTMAINAHRRGRGVGRENMLYGYLGDGLGFQVILNGCPYRGDSGVAGELGHVAIDEDGPICNCGNRGCLQTYASTAPVLGRAESLLAATANLRSSLRDAHARGELNLSALMRAARAGDKLAYRILDETGAHVGKVVAIALNFLAPGLVILGGPLVDDGGIILEAVQRQVRLRALQHISQTTEIVYDDQGVSAAARGAVFLALDSIFEVEANLCSFQAAQVLCSNENASSMGWCHGHLVPESSPRATL